MALDNERVDVAQSPLRGKALTERCRSGLESVVVRGIGDDEVVERGAAKLALAQ